MDFMQNLMDAFSSTTSEIIDRKEFVSDNGVSVFAEISVVRDNESGEIINAGFNVHYNGLYVKNTPSEYRDAIKLAQEIVAAFNRGEELDIEMC